MHENPRYFACIMAGGSGERFWPMSRARSPKQLTRLFGDTTLIADTVRRLEGIVPRENILVLTNHLQLDATRAALPGLPPEQVFAEPAKRDTAPAAALAAALVRSRDPQAVMAVLSSDALIHDGARFGQQLRIALERASASPALLTFAIPPTHPATGFGYLETGEELARGAEGSVIRRVQRFVEKPDLATAQQYVAGGRHFWNAGMFVWRAESFLAEADRLAPGLAAFIRGFPSATVLGAGFRGAAETYVQAHFPTLEPRVSLDYAIMEKAAAVETVIAAFDWDDVGLWTALPKHLPSDASGNTLRGATSVIGSSNNIVVSNGRTIALCGVSDLVVVETADAVLVCHRDAVQQIKQLMPQLPKELL